MDLNHKKQRLQEVVLKAGFQSFEWVKLEKPLSFELYDQWIKEGYQGQMNYLKDHLPLKENPQLLMPQARSALVVTLNYLPHPSPVELPFKNLRTAFYAQGEDYHLFFKNQLRFLILELQKIFPDEKFEAYTDSSPVLERDLAAKAGLGWIGKNNCLIHPKQGSLCFIGEIYSSLEVSENPQQMPDFCGTCQRCIQACPTQALEKPRWLNSEKCISYWTIESSTPPPFEMAEKFGDLFFGCDICQTVCPWNQKVFGRDLHKPPQTEIQNADQKELLIQDLRWVLTTSGKQIQRSLKNSTLSRAGHKGLKKNALIVIHNLKIKELKEEVEKFLEDPKLKDLAQWTLKGL
jgi:epoxyqueuosine reductase